MNQFLCRPGGELGGRVRVPGDKSISHRSIIFSSIAEGTSRISGFLSGEDSMNTLRAFQAMGVNIDCSADAICVHGVGLHGLQPAEEPLQMGNSGTAMRLMLGLLAGQSFDSSLIGDESLSVRPMNRVIKPLTAMGAVVTSADGGCAPLQISGGQKIRATEYDMPVASAQVKSCILLAGIYAGGITRVREPAPTRDHSERMLRGFGCEVVTQGAQISFQGGQSLRATNIEIPADISSAAFFMVAASIAPNSEIVLEHVGINPTRTGVIDILRLMGADITLSDERDVGGEPVADITVRSAVLNGIDIPQALVPLAIDEFPVLFIAAACARGTTRLSGAEELRVKESDRIQVMADGLQSLGIEVTTRPDGLDIVGGKLSGGRVDSHGDHRCAMAFSVAALCCKSDLIVDNCSNVDTSFPGYVEISSKAGLKVDINE
ncbi:MAG: 3-phosphoshikimate 1-carboxyvinyltransferase [Planctomycetota bacterium]|jgi:3-phosphoshikimate 1-carboxyvinyltransferase